MPTDSAAPGRRMSAVVDSIRGLPPVQTRLDLAFDPSRRRFLTGAAAAALLTACSNSGSNDRSDSDPDDGFPRTVTHGLGATEVPARPTRIVATADRDQLDVLLAMGVSPVLFGRSGDYAVAAPWLDQDTVASLEWATMADAFVPNLERIAAVHPT